MAKLMAPQNAGWTIYLKAWQYSAMHWRAQIRHTLFLAASLCPFYLRPLYREIPKGFFLAEYLTRYSYLLMLFAAWAAFLSIVFRIYLPRLAAIRANRLRSSRLTSVAYFLLLSAGAMLALVALQLFHEQFSPPVFYLALAGVGLFALSFSFPYQGKHRAALVVRAAKNIIVGYLTFSMISEDWPWQPAAAACSLALMLLTRDLAVYFSGLPEGREALFKKVFPATALSSVLLIAALCYLGALDRNYLLLFAVISVLMGPKLDQTQSAAAAIRRSELACILYVVILVVLAILQSPLIPELGAAPR